MTSSPGGRSSPKKFSLEALLASKYFQKEIDLVADLLLERLLTKTCQVRHGLLHHLGDQDHPLRGLQQPSGPVVEEVVATEPGMLNYFVSNNYVIGLLFTLMFHANYIPSFALIGFFLGSGHCHRLHSQNNAMAAPVMRPSLMRDQVILVD